MLATISIVESTGTAHCVDVRLIDCVADQLLLVADYESVQLSFAGVRALAPSFATALLLLLREHRRNRPHSSVRLTDLTSVTAPVLLRSKAAIDGDEAG